MPEIIIKNRPIGDEHPPIVIAEIGINHGGSLDLAIRMADAAIDAGVKVDPIKVCALAVGTLAEVDASHRAGIHAIGYALADVGNDRVSH